MFDASPFLEITLFELIPFFSFQTQTRIAQGRIDLPVHALPIKLFALPHNLALLGTHLHPTLRVTAKCLSIFRRHRDPPIARIIVLVWDMSRRGKAPGIPALRLGIGYLPAEDQNRRSGERAYSVCVSSSSSHKLLSSVVSNSSRSATTS